MKITGFRIILLILLVMQIGCLPQKEPLQSVNLATSTSMPMITHATKSPPSDFQQYATAQITPTPKKENEANAINQCKDVSPVPSTADFGFDGVIAYYDKDQDSFILLGQQPLTQAKIPISRDYYEMVGFSPDGKWLGFISHDLGILAYATGGQRSEKQVNLGDIQKLLPADATFQGWTFPDWVNSNLLRTGVFYSLQDDPNFRDILFVNPFDAKLYTDYIPVITDRGSGGALSFSPDLKRAIYVSTDGESNALTLFNMETNEPLLRIKPFFDPNVVKGAGRVNDRIAWTNNSEWVAYTEAEEPLSPLDRVASHTGLYILDRDGKRGNIQITNFHKEYKSFQANNPAWSHDNRFLAFSVSASTDDGDGLKEYVYVYDVSNNSFTMVCPAQGKLISSLAWSPDSRYIAYSVYTYEYIYGGLYIIDLQNGDVVKIAENVNQLGGWSINYSQ